MWNEELKVEPDASQRIGICNDHQINFEVFVLFLELTMADHNPVWIEVTVAFQQWFFVNANSILPNHSQGHAKRNLTSDTIGIRVDVSCNHNIPGFFSQVFEELNHSHILLFGFSGPRP